MPELVVDFITSLDGYASAAGWPGWWGLQGPEYLTWLAENPEGYAIARPPMTARSPTGSGELSSTNSLERRANSHWMIDFGTVAEAQEYK